MSALTRTAAAAVLFVATLTASSTASAAPDWAEADEHFKHGVALFNELSYGAALVEFKRAYEIDPKYQVLYNIGETHYMLLDYANALKALQRYLADGGTKISPARRKAVEEEIKILSGRVATLTITTNEPGASISVDDVPVGTAPLEAQLVSAGRRKVTVSLQGRVPVTEMVDIAGGDKKTIRLEIAPLTKTIEVIKPGDPAAPPPPSVVPTVVGWSATGALVTGAVITGVLALGASSDLEAELVRFPGDAEALASAKSAAFGFGLATDILIGTSIAAAGLAVYFTVDWSLASDEAARGAPAASARLRVTPGGVALEGAF